MIRTIVCSIWRSTCEKLTTKAASEKLLIRIFTAVEDILKLGTEKAAAKESEI